MNTSNDTAPNIYLIINQLISPKIHCARFLHQEDRNRNYHMNFTHRYQPALSWLTELDRFFDRNTAGQTLTVAPRESVYESEQGWVLSVELPGFSKEEIHLSFEDRLLVLTAEGPVERPFGSKIDRRWKLGEDVDGTAISARLENGVLELNIPKKTKEITQPTRIEIQ